LDKKIKKLDESVTYTNKELSKAKTILQSKEKDYDELMV